MTDSKQKLVYRFKAKETDALVSLHKSGRLTEEEQLVLLEELADRGETYRLEMSERDYRERQEQSEWRTRSIGNDSVQRRWATVPDGIGSATIFLVHGTWANVWSPLKTPRWFEPGHPFYEDLTSTFGHRVAVRAFTWGWGPNLHSARMKASRLLADEIRRAEPSRVFLIGHSHGGNVCLLACQDADVRERVVGLVSLSTPFIVIERARFAERVLAFSVAAMTAITGFVGARMGFEYFDSILGVVAIHISIGLAALMVWLFRSATFDLKDVALPVQLPFESLILRVTGDEASGVLGVLAPLERLISQVTSRVTRLSEHVFGRFAGMSDTAIVCWTWIASSVALWFWFHIASGETKNTIAQVGTIVVFAIFVVVPSMMLLRSPYGWDLALRALPFDVTAEHSPPGKWIVQTFRRSRPTDSGTTLSHSEIYEAPQSRDAVVEFLGRLLETTRQPEASGPKQSDDHRG